MDSADINKKERSKNFLEPFSTINDNITVFFLWFSFTVFAGLFGVVFNIISRSIKGNSPFLETLYLDSNNGSFYTYSIALLAATLGSILINMSENPLTKFRNIKIVTIVVLFFTWIFASIFYTSSQPDNLHANISNSQFEIDLWQLGFLAFSIFISIYSYSILRLEINYAKYEHLDSKDYNEKDDEQVEILNSSSISANKDSKGNKL